MRHLNSNNIIKIKDYYYKILISYSELLDATTRLAKKIVEDSNGLDTVLLFVTNGGIYIGTMLSVELDLMGFNHKIDTINVTRYTGDAITGELIVNKEPVLTLNNKRVIIVEDLIDEGLTLNFIHKYLEKYDSVFVQYFVVVIKEEHKELLFNIDYYIHKAPNLGWLVGSGMDSEGNLRGLPFICEKLET